MTKEQKVAIAMTLLAQANADDPTVDDKIQQSIGYLEEVLNELMEE